MRIFLSPHPCVHEDEVELAEGEDHLEDGVDAPEHLVARRVPGNLEERPQLHPVVHHRPQAEGCNTGSESLHTEVIGKMQHIL